MTDNLAFENYFTGFCKKEIQIDKYLDSEYCLANQINIFYEGKKINTNESFDIALFSFKIDETAKYIRQELYALSGIDKNINIIDFGNLKTDAEKPENNAVLREALLSLKNIAKTVILLSNDNSLIRQIYDVYEFLEFPVNINHISAQIAFEHNNQDIKPGSLSQILLAENHFLFNYINLGFQIPYTPAKLLDFINKNNFEAYRYSQLRNNIEQNEYLLRDGQVTVINLSSVRYLDAPEVINPKINGFSAFEICQMAYYSGASDNTELFAVLELKNIAESDNPTIKLTAQIIWYFIWGFVHRENDNPVIENPKYKRYSVSLDKSDNGIVFYQNTLNNRWWFEVDFGDKKIFISCSENDYKQTIKGNIPLRWIKYYNKM